VTVALAELVLAGAIDTVGSGSGSALLQLLQVVGDNIRLPGAPDYLEYLQHGEGQKLFTTQAIASHC
jgi:hypothetical protein